MLVLASVSLGFAVEAAEQTANKTLQYSGTSQLESASARSISSDDLRVSPHPESDASITGIYPGPSSATVPTISAAAAQSVAGNGAFFGFNALNHRDQRLAGTGTYVNSQFSTEPPDPALAVGNGFVLEAVNAALAVYDAKSGALLKGPTALNQFFHLKPEVNRSTGIFGDFSSDPRAYYDAQLQRWFLTVLEISTNPASGAFAARSHVLIAVSQTDDPTQDWNLYSIDTSNDGSEGCPCFGDQPLIGANAHGFFVSTNAFSLKDGFAGVQIYAISKQLLAAGAVPAVVHFNAPSLAGGFAFTVQPAISTSSEPGNDSARGGTEHFMSVADIRNFLDNRIAVWAMTNTRSLTETAPSVDLKSVIVKSQPFGVPPDAPQRPGPAPLGSLAGAAEEFIATNDQRMQQTVFADGVLWSSLTSLVAFDDDPNPHAGIAYFIVHPSIGNDGSVKAEISRQGYIAVLNNDVFFPSIAVNEKGMGAVTFALAGGTYYPSAAFANISVSKGPDSIQILAPGAAPDDGFSGYSYFGGGGSGRGGDYSAAVADGNGSIWTAVEYISGGLRTLLANWSTFIARINPSDEPQP